jgi:hypothetical protein
MVVRDDGVLRVAVEKPLYKNGTSDCTDSHKTL